jgi:hypothetical protein
MVKGVHGDVRCPGRAKMRINVWGRWKSPWRIFHFQISLELPQLKKSPRWEKKACKKYLKGI